MTLRRNEPAYLAHVDAWWAALFARLRRFLWQRGGPIVMVQVRAPAGPAYGTAPCGRGGRNACRAAPPHFPRAPSPLSAGGE